MIRFAQTCEAIAATTKKLQKTALVSDYLRSLPVDNAAIASLFLSGRPFASHRETTLQVGGALLWRTISELSGKSEQALTESYRRHGDAGAVAADVLPPKPEPVLSLQDVQASFDQMAVARGPAAKALLLRDLLQKAAPIEAKYIVKIISGDLRIGLKESLVEEAIAKAFEVPMEQVKRANMLLGDIGETLRLAVNGKLAEAGMRIFHPIDFMLASPVESAQEALSYFENAAVEDKYDGIRAQAHISKGEAHLYSRTRDEITESFPELPPALAGLPDGTILDGEIVAWSPHGAATPTGEKPTVERNPGGPDAAPITNSASAAPRALPFSTLQQRLGRKKVSEKMMREIPVAYLVFDILCADGELLLDLPLRERAQILDKLLAAPRVQPAFQAHAQSQFAFQGEEHSCAPVLRAPISAAHSPEDIEALFTAARARGNEGLMIKDPESR